MTTGTLEIGGQGALGIGLETTMGTYAAPTKFIPIRSESLVFGEPDKTYRTNIRGKAGRTGAIRGHNSVEGDIVFEVTSDTLVYLMFASRISVVKTGTTPNFTYTFTPAHFPKPSTAATGQVPRTMSIYVARSAIPMAYLGCVVTQWSFTLDAGVLMCTAHVMGVGESVESSTAATYTTNDPFSPGDITLEVPNASVRADADTWSLTINENATQEYRLTGTRTPAYISYHDREVTSSFEIDYSATTDFDAFVAQTQQTLHLLASNGANDQVDFLLNATIFDTAEMTLAGLGDLNREAISLHGIDAGSGEYTITIKTSADIA